MSGLQSVFSWRRNAKYVDDVLTDEGNAFQAQAAGLEYIAWNLYSASSQKAPLMCSMINNTV